MIRPIPLLIFSFATFAAPVHAASMGDNILGYLAEQTHDLDTHEKTFKEFSSAQDDQKQIGQSAHLTAQSLNLQPSTRSLPDGTPLVSNGDVVSVIELVSDDCTARVVDSAIEITKHQLLVGTTIRLSPA